MAYGREPESHLTRKLMEMRIFLKYVTPYATYRRSLVRFWSGAQGVTEFEPQKWEDVVLRIVCRLSNVEILYLTLVLI